MADSRSTDPNSTPRGGVDATSAANQPGAPILRPPGMTPPADFLSGPEAEFLFRAGELTNDDLRVVAFDGTEGLSELFEFRVELLSWMDNIDPDRMIGTAATLDIRGQRGVRSVHGIIRRFERLDGGDRFTRYEALLVPLHWMLTRRLQSRIFQQPRHADTSTLGIVREVFKAAGLPEKALTSLLSPRSEYPPREFTVQYRESDWDFACRLLEDEGIHFFFEHDDDGCHMVVADAPGVHAPLSADGGEGDALPYVSPNGLVPEREFVYRVRLSSQMRIGAVTLDDFDFGDPGGELRVSSRGSRFTGLQSVDSPGRYRDKRLGQHLADVRLQEQQVSGRVARMNATARTLAAGRTFALTDHAVADGRYLVTHLVHRAVQSQSGEAESGGDGPGTGYEAQVTAIPADVTYRPPRTTPRPTVLGSQSAIIVGPDGEEIHTDAYGRVKVRFHWDQEAEFDEKASCWIRVSQGWAGGQYGMMFLPRVGQEVIVDFLEGDPDRPMITGRVYNKDHMPPYKLPENRTVSSIRTCSSPGAKGGNEIRFEDKKGGEQLLLFAQNALHMRSRGNRYESVCGSAHQTVAGDAFESVNKSKHEHVELDRIAFANGSKMDAVSGDVWDLVGRNRYADTIGDQINKGTGRIVLVSESGITLSCLGNFITVDENGVTIVAKAVNINSGGAADVPEFPELPDALSIKKPAYADTTEFGHNVRYSRSVVQSAATESDETKEATSWIDIELVDEAGRPVPNEVYSIILPDGKKIGGTLDKFGRAHVAVADPGLCQVTFPRLDAAAWEAIA